MDDFQQAYVDPQFFDRQLDSEDPKAQQDLAADQLGIVVDLLVKLADKKIALEKFLKGQKFNEVGKKNLLYNYEYVKEAYDKLNGIEDLNPKPKKVSAKMEVPEMPKFDNLKLAEQIAVQDHMIKQSVILEDDNMQHRFVSSLVGNRNLNLVYRASVHGDDAEDYHNNCDGKTNTLTLIKAQSGNIFGGYRASPILSDDKWVTDPHAFIFSVDQTEKYKIKQGGRFACNNFKAYGPTFGQDIGIPNQSLRVPHSYSRFGMSYMLPEGMTKDSEESKTHLAGEEKFQCEEVEVYIVC